MKRFFTVLLALCTISLSGCTDIRRRRYGKSLSIQTISKTAQMLCYDEDSLITAAYTAPQMLPDALSQASGMEVHFGHLAILMVQSQNSAVVRDLLSARFIVPTCPVLLSDKPIEINENANISDRLDAAVRTGLIPLRTVGDAVGDWQHSTCTTLLPYLQDGNFRLAVCDESHVLSILSEDASRGAALLCGSWKKFSCTDDNNATSLKKCRCRLSVSNEGERLILHADAKISVLTGNESAAQNAVRRMLTAFLREAVCAGGTDTCFLQETAAKFGVHDLSAEQLRNAEISVSV